MFNHCTQILTKESIVEYPDFEKPWVLTTDTSNFAIGAILLQWIIDSD